MKTNIIKNKPKIAIIQDFYKHYYGAEKIDCVSNPKALVCEWEDLKGKNILNKNVLIDGFGDIHPFPNPPIFEKAENIYLLNNYKYFHYYWLNKTIFPTNPIIYLRGHPCDSPVLNRGFRIYASDYDYHTAIRYAKDIGTDTSLIHEISEDEYNANVNDYEVEEIQLVDNVQYDKNEYETTEKDIDNCGGIISAAIMKKTGWN
jgi:hypothetical protein